MKNTMRTVLLALVFLAAVSVAAQESGTWSAGLSGDYGINEMISTTGYRKNTGLTDGESFSVSIPVRYQVSSWLGVETGLRYTRKDWGWSHDAEWDAARSLHIWEKTENHFLEIPVTVDLSVGDDTARVSVGAGGYFGFWLASRHSGVTMSPMYTNFATCLLPYDEPVEWNAARDNRFEAGVIARAGFEMAVSHCIVLLRGSYYYSLTDLGKPYQKDRVARHNSTFCFEMGFMLAFGEAAERR